MTLTLTQHPLAVHGQCMDPTGTLVCRVHETHVLGDDAVEVLGPRRPAFDIPRVLVTVLVAQHRGLAGRVGAGGVPGALTPRQQVVVISEGSMDGFASTVTKYSFES